MMSVQILDAQQAQWEAELQTRQAMAQIEAMRKPFDETEEFRDFVVWLCGFADHDELPDPKDWRKLQKKVRDIAAKFATRSLNPPLEPIPLQGKLWATGTYTLDSTNAPWQTSTATI